MEKSEDSESISRDVIGPLGATGGVGGGIDARERAELIGEVLLIVVAALQSNLCPGEIDACVQLGDRALKALDAGPNLRREAHLLAKDLGEAAFAPSGVPGHAAN